MPCTSCCFNVGFVLIPWGRKHRAGVRTLYAPQEDVGQPGCTDAERERLGSILRAGSASREPVAAGVLAVPWNDIQRRLCSSVNDAFRTVAGMAGRQAAVDTCVQSAGYIVIPDTDSA